MYFRCIDHLWRLLLIKPASNVFMFFSRMQLSVILLFFFFINFPFPLARNTVQLYNACLFTINFALVDPVFILLFIRLSYKKNSLTRPSLQLCNSLYSILVCFFFVFSPNILQVIKVLSWVYLSMEGEVNGAICPWKEKSKTGLFAHGRRSQRGYLPMKRKVSGFRLGAECRFSCI